MYSAMAGVGYTRTVEPHRLVDTPQQRRYKRTSDILHKGLSTDLGAVVLLGGMFDLPVLHVHPGAVREMMGEATGASGQE